MSKPTKSERQSLSKTLRFEVFKRDSFKCQYCGASAPDVLLHVDHIKPVADGGMNDITNLITACMPCNLGKRDKSLSDDTAINKRKAQLDDLQERREQLEMMMEWMQGLQDIKTQALDRLVENWVRLAPGFRPNDTGRNKIRKWLTKYSMEEIINAMEISASQYLKFQKDGCVTEESWDIAFNKIAPILSVERDAKDDPDLKDLLYIRGIVRNKCGYFDNTRALEWLRAARSWGVPMAELKQLAYGVRSWSHFDDLITETITAYKSHQDQE